MPLDLKFKIFDQIKQVQAFSKTLFFTFSINMHLPRKSIFADMKPLLWLKNYTLLSLRERNQENRAITKFSITFAKSFWEKPKTHILAILIRKKLRIIQLFGKQLFLSLQANRQKVKILLTRVIKAFLIKKNFVKYLTHFSYRILLIILRKRNFTPF